MSAFSYTERTISAMLNTIILPLRAFNPKGYAEFSGQLCHISQMLFQRLPLLSRLTFLAMRIERFIHNLPEAGVRSECEYTFNRLWQPYHRGA